MNCRSSRRSVPRRHHRACRHAIGNAANSSLNGLYRYPVEQATVTALHETRAFLAANATPETVIFACFDGTVHAAYLAALVSRSDHWWGRLSIPHWIFLCLIWILTL